MADSTTKRIRETPDMDSTEKKASNRRLKEQLEKRRISDRRRRESETPEKHRARLDRQKANWERILEGGETVLLHRPYCN